MSTLFRSIGPLLTLCGVGAAVGFAGCGGTVNGSDSTYIDDAGTFSEGGTTTAADLPCDLAKALERCFSCHGSTPLGDAKVSLNSYAALTAKSPTDPSLTVAQHAIVRMKDAAKPMPPSPSSPATTAEIDTLQKWIDAGMPKGDCGAAPDPFAQPPKCTSGATYTGGDRGKGDMYPGQACIACHLKEREGQALWLGGTVYPSAHEPNDCIAKITDSPVQVVITDSNSPPKTYTLTASPASGNFRLPKTSATGFKMPYTAKVVYQGRERVMVKPQTDGDCNGCHSAAGTAVPPSTDKAPGRILLP